MDEVLLRQLVENFHHDGGMSLGLVIQATYCDLT
jgi:hypothetical protein